MALIDKLSTIGDAIREKTGKEDLLTLDQMPEEIKSISGGGEDIEPYVFTGEELNNKTNFSYGFGAYLADTFSKYIKTQDLTGLYKAFDNCPGDTIDININMNFNTLPSGGSSSNSLLGLAFNNCTNLRKIPKFSTILEDSIISSIPLNYSLGALIFTNCYKIKEIPDNFFTEQFGSEALWRRLQEGTSIPCYHICNRCYSLRTIPSFACLGNIQAGNSLYYGAFEYCYVLEEVELPVLDGRYTYNNQFQKIFYFTHRLKKMIFETNTDGSPMIVNNWKQSQFIDLTNYVGYAQDASNILNYSEYHGITEETKVIDNATYQALKDNPDYWTTNVKYSRYNHDSALETIMSLPDVSGTGLAHTIKFTGQSGELTDGGAINTLTEEEIAVAANKGWTITLV